MYSSRFDIATQEIERPLLAYSGRIPEAAQTSAMADYVDCSIMWTVLCGMALEPCVIWVFGY